MRWPASGRSGPCRFPVAGPVEPVGRTRPPRPAERGAIRFAEPGPRVTTRSAGHARRSSWQLAQRAWQDAGLQWEDVPVVTTEPYSPGTDPYAADAYSPARFAAASASFYPLEEEPAGEAAAPWPEQPEPPAADPWPTGIYPTTMFAAPGAFGAPPLSAPVAPAAPVNPSAPAVPATPARRNAESDKLFRAWQRSVRAASAGHGPWRGRAALRIGVPAAVIVAVGACALLMLTGRANDMLAGRASPGPLASSPPAARTSPASAGLFGYPGEHGTVGVNGLWSAGGLSVAVGYADNHPAVWRRAAGGTWSLVSGATLGGLPGHLTSVAAGPLGWVAAGSDQVNGTVQPVAYRSADGVTWTPLPVLTSLAGSGAQFLGVTAGAGGYLVVGRTGSGSHVTAAMWWSGDLKSWMNGADTANPGSLATAAVPLGDGFAAVGSELNCHTIWTSPDGKQWTGHDLAKPAGAQSATLRSVAAGAGNRIVAGGFAVKDGRDLALVVTSPDGGRHFTQVVLAPPAGAASGTPATVTAVTATSIGFVAAGEAGPPSAPHPVTWTSKDGLTWSAARPLGPSSGTVTALTSTGPGGAPAVDATVQQGTGTALVLVPAG